MKDAETHKVTGTLRLDATGEPLPHIELELWDRDLTSDDFLSRGFTDARGHFEIAYDPRRAGAFDIPDLDLRVIERTRTGRREVHRERGDDDVSALVYDFGDVRVPTAPAPTPLDRIPSRAAPAGPGGMPKTHPLCLPTPYSKQIHARQFLATVDPTWLAEDLPPCLEVLPGFESTCVFGVMDYPAAFSTADPTGAVYRFQELVIAAIVRERGSVAPGDVGLYFLAIYITTDVAVAVGREMYGFPKKQAEVVISDRSLLVRRSGLLVDEPGGPVHPIDLVRGTWEPSAREDLAQALRNRFFLLGAKGAAAGMNTLFDLPFYNHQVILAPRRPDGTTPYISRVWKASLRDVKVARAAVLANARFTLAPSKTDPIYRLAPGTEPVVEAPLGVELEVTFSMDEAELIADYSPNAAAAPGLTATARRAGSQLVGAALERLRR